LVDHDFFIIAEVRLYN